jgi:hypothetical protein
MSLSRSIAVLLLGVTLHAQQEQSPEVEAAKRAAEEAAARREEARRLAEEQQFKRELEENNRRMQELLADSREMIADKVRYSEAQREVFRREKEAQFNRALLAFEASRHRLLESLTSRTSLKEPAKSIEKSVGTILGFVKSLHKDRAQLDAAQLKGFTAVELGWEALTTAERVAPQLISVVDSQNAYRVDIRFLQSLTKLEGELLRLQWMARRLQ